MAAKHRVSRLFKIKKTQASLDFVDVDIKTDTRVFLSPRAFQQLQSNWEHACVSSIQDFFGHVLTLIRTGEDDEAISLLSTLREPNETHLGLSRGRSKGRGMGVASAERVWASLSQSVAVKTGLLRDLEDTVLLVPKVSVDIVSDITTNIIRRQLIEYTQEMARQEGIPLSPGIESGPLWNSLKKCWEQEFTELPMTSEGKLLLVPKIIVRQTPFYSIDKYLRHYLLVDLQRAHENANTHLVTILRDGRRKFHKSDIIDEVGGTKKDIIEETLKSPSSLERYRNDMKDESFDPLDHDDLADVSSSKRLDWQKLLQNVLSLDTGKADAGKYEKAVEALINALFYPDIVYPQSQHMLDNGKQRVDITYNNEGKDGFFKWLLASYPSQHVFVECKNYKDDPKNPELAQILMRMSPSRGKFGLLICRKIKDKKRLVERCKDAVKSQASYVLPLDDQGLTDLVNYREKEADFQEWILLRQLFRDIVS